MSIIDRFMKRKKQRQYLDQRIIWGIWAPRRLQLAYKMVASELRVPMSVLVGYILRLWLSENYETLRDDESVRTQFAEHLVRTYLHSDQEEQEGS
jgi:hypothetical protein